MKTVQSFSGSPTARPTSTTVLLIRHAETDAMASRLCGRLPRVELSPAGAKQAADLARRLSGLPIGALYSSPLLRARATADALAAQLEVNVTIEHALTEVDFGEWTGLTFDALSRRADWTAYNRDRGRASIPGGEAPADSAARMTRALHELRHRHAGATIAVVTHAELIRYAILTARELPLARWPDVNVPPASVTILEFI